jgi:hypothetical protein
VKLTTIWTMPAMTLRERLRRTADAADIAIAARLPKRVRYWAVVLVGAKVTTTTLRDREVPGVLFMEILEHADGHPRT